MICEMAFHKADTVNVRAKTYKVQKSSLEMGKMIFQREGMYGLFRGISACYYGSIYVGLTYFTLYKLLKEKFRETFKGSSETLVFFCASMVAELCTLTILYPFDTKKTRLQAMNSHYQYKNLIHAFRKEISTHGFFSIYRGGSPFTVMQTSVISIQFTTYESIIKWYKEKLTKEEFQKQEMKCTLIASVAAGGIASAVTNWMEVIVVHKQTRPSESVRKITQEVLSQEGLRTLMTKGIGARVGYYCMQSCLFFTCLNKIGKLYDVDLTD